MVKAPIGIEVIGLTKVSAYLASKNINAKNLIKKAINKAGIFVQGEVKLSIAGKKAEFQSVDTGRFLNSVDFVSSSDEAVVFSQVPYADKLEYGTNFKNSPRKHFTNSAARSKTKVNDIIKKELATL